MGTHQNRPRPSAVGLWAQITLYRLGALAVSGVLLLASLDAATTAPAQAAAWWFLLASLSALGALLHRAERRVGATVLIIVEGVLAALLAGWAPDPATVLALYLLVPAVWAGLALPLRASLPIAFAIGVVFLLASVEAGAGLGGARPRAEWVLLVAIATLTARWAARIQVGRPTAQQEYTRALALLQQLATLTRRLPQGLDRVAILDQFDSQLRVLHPDAEVAIATVAWPGQGVDPDPFGELPANLLLGLQRVVETRRSASGSYPDSPGSWALVPLVSNRAVLAVAHCRLPGPPLRRPALRDLEVAAGLAAVQLASSDVFAQIRDEAIADERSRVSRQIHDGVAQDLAALAYFLDANAIGSDADQHGVLAQASEEVRRLVDELRFSIFDLRTDMAAEERLGTALAGYVRQVGERSGMRVHVDIDDASADVPADVAHELMRIAQESVTNARRHASARSLWLVLRIRPDGVLLRVADDGRGVNAASTRLAGDGVGIGIMQERAARLGATLTVRPSDDGGTVVECRLTAARARLRITAGARPLDTTGDEQLLDVGEPLAVGGN